MGIKGYALGVNTTRSLIPSLVKSPITGGDIGASGRELLASIWPSDDTIAIVRVTANMAF